MKKSLIQLRLILFLILWSVCTKSIAQKQGQEKIDSLQENIKSYKSVFKQESIADSNKVITLFALSAELSSDNTERALSVLQQAKEFSHRINFYKGEIMALTKMGIINDGQGRYEEGLSCFQYALKISQQYGFKNWSAMCYNNMGHNYQTRDKYAEAIESFKNSLKINKEINNKDYIAEAYQKIAYIYKTWGNYSEAVKNYESYIKTSEEINKENNIAYGYVNIGEIYKIQGNYPLALKNSFVALKITENTQDSARSVDVYNTIGSVYFHMKDYENAVKNYLFSLQISTAIGFKKGAADAYENIGNVYTEQGYSEKSMNNYNAALLIYKEIGYKNGVAACNNGIGYVKYKQGLYSDALKNFTVSLDEYTEIQYKAGIALAYLNLGRTTLRLKNYNAAEKHLNTGLSLSKEMRSREYIRDSFKELSFLDSTQGKWHDAFLNHRMYALYNDSLSDEENIKKTVQAQMQYQFDKKESTTKAEQEKKDAIAKQELEKQKLIRNSITGGAGILGFSGIFSFFFYKRKRDAEQKQKETFLSLQVSETEMKALRSQMNPHFIFNALQSIQTFLLSHKSEEANLYLLKFSKLMRAVLENSQHSEVSLKDDMQALELYMQLESIRLTHPFTYQFHIDESVDTESDSIPPLILQPFVENAIWHGLQYKKEAGHINIFISKKNNALYATVEDNGVGRDMSKQVAQPMLLKKESLGMKLTEERLKVLNEVKKFNAHFTITDLFTKENKPAGTKIELSLPLVA